MTNLRSSLHMRLCTMQRALVVGFTRLKTSLEERSCCQLKGNVLELSCCGDTHHQKKSVWVGKRNRNQERRQEFNRA
ncbi:hypothetical protein AOLI_G00128320 [Acnodon oligacanthus]